MGFLATSLYWSSSWMGNNAIAVHNWFTNNAFSVGTETATPAPDRNYDYAFTNQWYEEGCNLSTFESAQRNDIDAARANLFAMHNRMHDWSYHLGFTEATWNMQRANFTEFGAGGASVEHEYLNVRHLTDANAALNRGKSRIECPRAHTAV